jgi:hypothetical protein
MRKSQADGKFVSFRVAPQDSGELETIQAYHGIKNRSDAIRFLIRQEARRIQQPTHDYTVSNIMAGYLGGLITAEEALQALSAHRDVVPNLA